MIVTRLGQTYDTVSTTAGDFQVVTDETGLATVFDPAGNIITDFSKLPDQLTNAINRAIDGTPAPGGGAGMSSGKLFLFAALAVVVLGLLSGGRR